MPSAVYVGPSDNLIVADKLYHPGDSVPIAKEARVRLEQSGHRFADSDEAEIAAEIAARMPAPADTRPRDDRGQAMDMPDARKEPAEPAIAPPARAVKAES